MSLASLAYVDRMRYHRAMNGVMNKGIHGNTHHQRCCLGGDMVKIAQQLAHGENAKLKPSASKPAKLQREPNLKDI